MSLIRIETKRVIEKVDLSNQWDLTYQFPPGYEVQVYVKKDRTRKYLVLFNRFRFKLWD